MSVSDTFPQGQLHLTKFGFAILSRKALEQFSIRNSMGKPKLIINLKPWSTMELVDLRLAIEQGQTIEMTAALLGREVQEVMRKAEDLDLIQPDKQQHSTD
jgi:hypothetical protein